MRHMRVLLFVAVLASASPAWTAWADASITGKACVVDGDSLAVGGTLNNEQWCRGGVQVRIFGIDAPEWNQTCTDAGGKEWARGKAAKKAMARMVEGKIVVCQERARDSYKRYIGYAPHDSYRNWYNYWRRYHSWSVAWNNCVVGGQGI